MNEKFYYATGIKRTPKEISFYNAIERQAYISGLKKDRERIELEGWIPVDDLMEKREGDDEFHYYLNDPEKSSEPMNNWVKLSYKINSHGFRSEAEMPQFKKPRSIITLGCSVTYGYAMPIANIWPTIVSHTLNHRLYNLAYPAGSLDKAFRLCLTWLPLIRPSHVFLLEPPGVRYETISHALGYFDHTIDNISGIPVRFEKEDEWTLHREKTLRAIKSVCDQFETPFISTEMDKQFYDDVIKNYGRIDSARDLVHPGRNCHKQLANQMLLKAKIL